MSLGPIDHHQLQEYSQGDLVFEQELLALFIADTQQHLEQLQGAVTQQEWETAREVAHHIKGASGHVGAQVMSRIAAQLETQSQQQQPLDLLFQDLQTAYTAVILWVANQPQNIIPPG
ncbi:MAG: Hpt domain-containing protein [Acaryochloridaceae cyanobacterium SU_2_1]|nr:Hpt domain-containing protein [Acaryochloridaceae cyanobacterium SU_2_1]NJM95350.1 Hpt domain-containing protein [Acaryochloridaceae cyanobacterium CSU_5_19]